MNISIASYFVILLAVLFANLPFLNEHFLFFIPLKASVKRTGKSFWMHALELSIYYLFVGGLAYLIEARIGNAFVQHWEFYAVTICLFIVLAYPGFVYHYLRKQREFTKDA